MDIKGIYGEALVKAFKLSDAMIDAMTDNVTVAKSATVKALAGRGLWNEAGKLTDLGEHVIGHLQVSGFCDFRACGASEDHPMQSDMITDIVAVGQIWNAAPIESLDLMPAMMCRRCKDSGREPGTWRDDCRACKNTDPQVRAEILAQDAALRHYMNATSDDVSISAYDAPQYRASKSLMISTGVAAYPDLTGDEIYELIHSFNEGESLRDLVEIFRANRESDRQWDEVATGEEHYESMNPETNELPGDAERTFDVENAAAEAASIRDEYAAELTSELVSEILADDALMHLTPKGIFVSGSYMNTMRRLAAVKRSDASGFALQRQHMIDEAPNLFALIDGVLELGEITFGEADREKRRIRAHCRPSVLAGRKHKPSAKRRNRR